MDFSKLLELFNAAKAVFLASNISEKLNASINVLKLAASWSVVTLDDQIVDYLDKINSDPAIHAFIVSLLERYLSSDRLQSGEALMLASSNEMEQLKAFNFDLDKIIALIQMLAQLIKTLS